MPSQLPREPARAVLRYWGDLLVQISEAGIARAPNAPLARPHVWLGLVLEGRLRLLDPEASLR
jgi:hypothetical protein